MLVLKINFHYDEELEPQFDVRFLDEKRSLGNDTKSVTFEFAEEGTYCIELVQTEETEIFSFKQKLMYILFLPLIGLVGVLSLYGESLSVFQKVNPYLISTRISMILKSDTTLDVVYNSSKFDNKTLLWTKPSLIAKNIADVKTVISKNEDGFINTYLGYKRLFFAVCFDVMLVFAIFAFVGIKHHSYKIFIAFMSLSVFVMLVCLITLSFTKRKILKMKKHL